MPRGFQAGLKVEGLTPISRTEESVWLAVDVSTCQAATVPPPAVCPNARTEVAVNTNSFVLKLPALLQGYDMSSGKSSSTINYSIIAQYYAASPAGHPSRRCCRTHRMASPAKAEAQRQLESQPGIHILYPPKHKSIEKVLE